MKMKFILLTIGFSINMYLHSQTVYIPSGTGGIGSSTNSNVGIGTTSTPLAKLHVIGASRFDENATGTGNGRFVLNRTGLSNQENLLSFSTAATNYEWVMGTTLASSDFYLGGWTNAGRCISVLQSNGNVGIGNVATPLVKLHVVGSFSLFSSNTSPTTAALIRGNSTYSTDLLPDYTWYGNDQTGIFHPAANVIGFANGGIGESMRINANGKVVIGGSSITNLPGSYKLYVSGGILTEQVRVGVYNTSGWADYVFDKNYKLMSLDSLSEYVNANQHLPNIPSASEVVKDGIDVAGMNSKLLEKIEELTLYVIDLQNQINDLQKSVDGSNK
jgi:hypothetical protein